MTKKQKNPEKKSLYYLKIDLSNRDQLTKAIIDQIMEMNTIEKINPKTFGKDLEKKLASGKTHMYLAFERDPITNQIKKNKLLGVAYGHLNGSSFYLSRFFVNKNIRNEGIGFKLLLHAYSHIIHKLKATKINMISYPGTSNINEKIVGRRYITIFKDGKPTEILRKFNSSFRLNLESKPDSKNLKKENIKVISLNKRKRVL
jgi:hypothetical protein